MWSHNDTRIWCYILTFDTGRLFPWQLPYLDVQPLGHNTNQGLDLGSCDQCWPWIRHQGQDRWPQIYPTEMRKNNYSPQFFLFNFFSLGSEVYHKIQIKYQLLIQLLIEYSILSSVKSCRTYGIQLEWLVVIGGFDECSSPTISPLTRELAENTGLRVSTDWPSSGHSHLVSLFCWINNVNQ